MGERGWADLYFWIFVNGGWCVSLSGKSNCDTDRGLLFFLHICIEITLNTFFLSANCLDLFMVKRRQKNYDYYTDFLHKILQYKAALP
jgi:hypothetical protein